jgi:histidinol-phosphate aminotransferase
MKRVIRQDIQSMHGYAVQPSAGMVKLDTMENPFRLPPALRHELGRRLAEVALNRYPAERGDVLRQALARHAGMPDECDIMLGNGSDELISLIAMACDVPGSTVLAPVPGFVMYSLAAKLQGLRFVGVPTTASFELDLPAMLAAVREHRPGVVYLAYPNNPTANLWDDAAIDAIIDAAPGLVVMDEAYQPFAARDSSARLRRHEHVLLMRTMSKFGLAGVRIGYLIRAERDSLLQQLTALPGVEPFPSQANMILARVPDSQKAFEGMKARGVLVKNVAFLHPLLHNCVRLTVGTPEENVKMMDALKASL